MRMLFRILVFVCVLALAPVSSRSQSPAAKQPKLVLVIMVDQFRYDYLTRFQADYTSGFRRLLTRGAVFTNAFLPHFQTVTAVGHSTVLTGATPALSGIVGNEWYDRESGDTVTSVSDPNVKLLGGENKAAASPRRLMVSTVGDELKIAEGGRPRVIGVSFKDRSAILPAGHMADGAYWFDASTGNFVTSTFYFSELPEWVRRFNAGRAADKFAGMEWTALPPQPNGPAGKVFKKIPSQPGRKYYDAVLNSPFGNDLLELFAERATEAEQLGARGPTDLLSVSFSSNDYVGHALGPDAPEVRDISIRTGLVIGKLFAFLDSRIGLDNILVVMSSDHGVAPVPEVQAERKMPGGRVSDKALSDTVQSALANEFGEGQWVLYSSYGSFYLNRKLAAEKEVEEEEVEQAAAAALASVPHVFRVYTREQLLSGEYLADSIGRRVANGFNAERSGDVIALLDPYWIFGAHRATHGSPFNYDSHVPVIFMGPGIKPGRYDASIVPNDIAPTLATILGIETPSGSVGRVLSEIIE